MVNYGVSKACQECKRRRKKCDETRPACLRCTRGKRECPGYQPDSDLVFRNICSVSRPERISQYSNNSSQQQMMLYDKTPLEKTEFAWLAIENSAIQLFMSDYCIKSSNLAVSRGYLHGLQPLVKRAGATSVIAQTLRIISLANFAKKTEAPELLRKTKTLYYELLPSFRTVISREGSATTIESLMTAVLLGLYEIITIQSTESGSHVAHAQGVSAILMNRYSAYDLVSGVSLYQLPNPLLDTELKAVDHNTSSATCQAPEKFSIICTPLVTSVWTTLDHMFVKTVSLKRRAEKLLSHRVESTTVEDIQLLKQEAESLRTDYKQCVLNISTEWKAHIIGTIPNSKASTAVPEVGYWPGPVLSYYDQYIASITNSYHKSQLSVLDIIVRCHRALPAKSQSAEIDLLIWEDAQNLASKIAASVPYYLSKDIKVFLDQAPASGIEAKTMAPGPSIGGLLIMHTLYMVSKMTVVDLTLKLYMKDCLAWIGRTMCIGQATVLSEDKSTLLPEYISQAHVLIWAGMLV